MHGVLLALWMCYPCHIAVTHKELAHALWVCYPCHVAVTHKELAHVSHMYAHVYMCDTCRPFKLWAICIIQTMLSHSYIANWAMNFNHNYHYNFVYI